MNRPIDRRTSAHTKLAYLPGQTPTKDPLALTPREAEIEAMARRGDRPVDIAERFGIKTASVYQVLRVVREKREAA